MLREQLGNKRPRFTDDQRRRLAAKGKALGRKILQQPYGEWMMQVARNLLDAEDGFLTGKRHLILDRDPLYTREYAAHYHEERNHQGLGSRLIKPPVNDNAAGTIECRCRTRWRRATRRRRQAESYGLSRAATRIRFVHSANSCQQR